MSSATTASPPTQVTELLFLHAQTSLHPGSGTALGVVDLPVQRERHTQWPIIPGSALKGILRDSCREKAKENYQDEYEDTEENGQRTRKLKRTRRQVANEQDEFLTAAFGPGKIAEEGGSHAGAASVTDARILAFPVRSLKGVFAWVTCASVLERLNRDLKLAGQPPLAACDIPHPGEHECVIRSRQKHPLIVDGNKVVLEEFEFTQQPGSTLSEGLTNTVQQAVDDLARSQVPDRLVVLQDDDFTHFVRHATEVVARIGLDYERKTVKSGALFYQECLPAETLFYSLVFVNPSRRDGVFKSAVDIIDYLRSRINDVKFLQIGGDETTGKGLCSVKLVKVKETGS